MAKVKGPLLSVRALNSLANEMTYYRTKGKNIARKKVTPADPRTAPQTTQRGHVTQAVDTWHATNNLELDTIDREAWTRFAGVLGPMSGFNAFVREWVREKAAGGTRVGTFNFLVVSDTQAASFDCNIEAPPLTDQDATIHMGTTKTGFTFAATVAALFPSVIFTNLVLPFAVGDRVFFFFDTGTVGVDFMRSGLYTSVLT